jgi:hypothetical protein
MVPLTAARRGFLLGLWLLWATIARCNLLKMLRLRFFLLEFLWLFFWGRDGWNLGKGRDGVSRAILKFFSKIMFRSGHSSQLLGLACRSCSLVAFPDYLVHV